MQYIFDTDILPNAYGRESRAGQYPEVPGRCPQRGCGMPACMKKHGFYSRNILLKGYVGVIRVRRYKCAFCGKTLSMLPSFCIPFLQYGAEAVIWAVGLAVRTTVSAALKACLSSLPFITRRHITYWLARIRGNLDLIRYGINQMSPATTTTNESARDTGSTELFLSESESNPQKFNSGFHKVTGKSFMSLHISVA